MAVNFQTARSQMLDQQLRCCEVTDPRILDILATTPREAFVPPGFHDLAFTDMSIPLGHDQFMLTPQIEGRILQALMVESIDEVLEIGTGSGYLTACLSRLGAQVDSIDIFADFVSAAQHKFAEHRLNAINARVADATSCEFERQYDAVVISAALPQLSERYINLVKPGGRMFVFTGEAPAMSAVLVTRTGSDEPEMETLFETVVEPMINARSDAAFVL